MATVEEYRAVHGSGPASRKDLASELGDGGCNVITNSGGVVGRWGSWEKASRALNELQKLGFGFEYRLEEAHQWVREAELRTSCSVCSMSQGIPALAGGIMGVDEPSGLPPFPRLAAHRR